GPLLYHIRAPLKIDRFSANCVSGLGAHVIDQDYLRHGERSKYQFAFNPVFWIFMSVQHS
ncbi:MAG: hypothetical protein WCJ75_15080, partial [Desulfomonile sp.]